MKHQIILFDFIGSSTHLIAGYINVFQHEPNYFNLTIALREIAQNIGSPSATKMFKLIAPDVFSNEQIAKQAIKILNR
jgi:hypothetical protein